MDADDQRSFLKYRQQNMYDNEGSGSNRSIGLLETVNQWCDLVGSFIGSSQWSIIEGNTLNETMPSSSSLFLIDQKSKEQ